MGRPARPRRGFSLVEMMIALLVLAFGVLIVGAALPIGIEYARKTTNAATGEATASYALDIIESYVRTSDTAIDSLTHVRKDALFRPRQSALPHPLIGQYTFNGRERDYEPYVKVRPFVFGNEDLTPARVVSPSTDPQPIPPDEGELIINAYMTLLNPGTVDGRAYEWAEYDSGYTDALRPYSLYDQPSIPGIARVYPPVAHYIPQGFTFVHPSVRELAPYDPNVWTVPRSGNVLKPDVTNVERLRAAERLVAWTAFYRRVSYQSDSDPDLYEVIVLVTRRPTQRHRYPYQIYQDPDFKSVFRRSQALPIDMGGTRTNGPGPDRLAPMPWLVTFKRLPPQPAWVGRRDRRLNQVDPAGPLEFVCTNRTSKLFPPGQVFIPAVNDAHTTYINAARPLVGFIPNSPDSLPVYEVIDRAQGPGNGEWTIRVKNNGLYPFVGSQTGDANVDQNPDYWPVWVIPPAAEAAQGDDHAFSDDSPIIGVSRRVIRIGEI
jgi:prepilin-type N-terminal cleavage/methylation domain-containing protein